MTTHIMSIQSIYLHYFLSGTKKVEGRINDEERQNIKIGDHIIFETTDGEKSEFVVIHRNDYPTIQEMLEEEGLENMLPDVKSLEEGVKLYRSLGDYAEKEPIFGMVALGLKPKSD